MSLPYDEPAVSVPIEEHLGHVLPRTKPQRDADAILDLLRSQWDAGRLPWVNAAEIVRALWPELAEEAKDLEDGKRRVRKAVETTMLIVSAPGSHGYALRARISPEQEVEACNARLSQARKNFKKAWRARKEALARMTPDYLLEAQEARS